MDQESSESARTVRAQRLAELELAIDRAQNVAWRLGVTEGDSLEALKLYGRLEAARDELEALKRGSWRGQEQAMDPFCGSLLHEELVPTLLAPLDVRSA